MTPSRQKIVDEPKSTTERATARPTSPKPRTTTATSTPRPQTPVTRRPTTTTGTPPRTEPRPSPTTPSTPPIFLQGENATGSSTSDGSCPPFRPAEGEDVKCLHAETAQVIDCTRKPAPAGTKAIIK